MKSVKISTRGLKRLKSTLNTESNIYIYGDELLKVLHKSQLNDERINTIKKLNDRAFDGCVMPKYCIENKDNNIVGYGMDYLKEYISLSDYITSDINLKKRKIIAYRICEIYNKLYDNNFAYYDCHTNNIMINTKNNDIKFIDIDSGLFKEDINAFEFEIMHKYSKNYIAETLLKTLIGYDYKEDNDNSIELRILSKYATDKQKILISHALGAKDGFEPEEYIDSINEDFLDTAEKVKRITM